jgi:hypothetical protein
MAYVILFESAFRTGHEDRFLCDTQWQGKFYFMTSIQTLGSNVQKEKVLSAIGLPEF